VDTALKRRWDLGRGKGTWKIEYVETGQAWPSWFAVRHMAAPGQPRYIVRYIDRGGRWMMGAILPLAETGGPSSAPVPGGPIDTPPERPRR
jgi:hypothetical protein